jgi:RNA polymerase sigma-70 factor (ECF subfamily)
VLGEFPLNLNLSACLLVYKGSGWTAKGANTVSKTKENEIILQLQRGSLDALGELYDRHRAMVYRTALVITGDQEAASDLLQDVFLRLYRFADRIDPTRPIEPWIYRMTANLSYTWVKRNRRFLRPLEDLAEWLAGSSKNQPYEAVEKRDDWDHVQQAVSGLPLPQRVVVVLYYLNDLSLQEISEILDVPVGTVKSRLHYGRKALKKNLGIGRLGDAEKLPDFNYERS